MRKASVSFLTVVLVTGCAQLLGKTDAPEPTPESPAATRLTVVAAGDLLIHPDVTDQATADARAAGRDGQDFTKIIADVRPVVSEADLAICHLETPLAEPSGPFSGYPLFNVPPAVADAAAWAGFDTCSTASNHSLDMGVAGIRRTLDKLDQVGLRHAGTARSAEEAAQPTLLDVNGVRVAHLSYTLSFNGIPRPAGQEWVANLLDQDAILAEARRARERGAEIVILSAHWGTEYQHEPDETQQQLARALLASPDIDLIVGHHAHVVQPFEKIGDKWVAYGLGNLTTHNRSEPVRHSVIPRFTFTRSDSGRWIVTDVEVVATRMAYEPAYRVIDVARALASGDLSAERRAELARAYDQIAQIVDRRRATAAGLRMARCPATTHCGGPIAGPPQPSPHEAKRR